LPLRIRRTGDRWQAAPSPGGLVAALGPIAADRDALWIGWAGALPGPDDAERRILLQTWERERGFLAVDLPARVLEGFYDGYANSTLWPLLHGFPGNVRLDHETWVAYREANERFANAVVEQHRPGDRIWVHDYQLALVPRLVRERLPDATIGFFLHVPFPASEIFRILPERENLLQGLLGADLIGFQTHGHLHDFRRAVLEILRLGTGMDRIEVDGRSVALAALPVGIVVGDWDRRLANPRIRARIRERLDAPHRARTILAVDRLDDTKGIPERLRAFRHLLRNHHEWLGRVQLVQVAEPSRERIPRYAELRRSVSELVGEVNGEFATPDWTPLVYLRRAIEPAELAVLYASADVCWVAPLRDGMNLVAKEYVACQAGGSGVLVLSEFAGAAQELGEAIRVNPFDMDGSAAAILRALTMPDRERRDRQMALLARVRRNDASAWSRRFLDDLRSAAGERRRDPPLAEAPISSIIDNARSADQRAFWLDYDGSLVAIQPRPADAVPTGAALEVLRRLVVDPANHVVLLSGRSKGELEEWFGGIAGLWIVAEHGILVRDPSTRSWRPLHAVVDAHWKDGVRPTLEQFADRAPGSFVEEKDFGLAWHYRLADPEFGAFLASELVALLHRQLVGTDLVVLSGRKVIEVRFGWATKGDASVAIRDTIQNPDFELAIGDDRTDEDLFERLPQDAWTLHVGRGPSRARYRVGDPGEVLSLLERLAAAELRPAQRPSTAPSAQSRARQAASAVAANRSR
jgi:trehalose 6-phosphate synthase/phosphatase